VRPYLQLGPMPKAMSSAAPGMPYQHSWRPGFAYDLIAGGWNAPPKDYAKWGELAYQWTRHSVERYGTEEVATWYFQLWNEPNGKSYWSGTIEKFHQLHDFAIADVRRAAASAGRWPGRGRLGRRFHKRFSQVHRQRHQLRHRRHWHTHRFPLVSRQRTPAFRRRPRPHGQRRAARRRHKGFTKIAAIAALKSVPIVIGGVRARPDVGVLASKTADGKVVLLSWHYHDDDVKGLDAAITLKLQCLGKGASARVTQWRVDQAHANAFTAWQAMGSPQSPDAVQYQALEAASAMPAVALPPLALKDGAASLSFALARQGVTLLIIE